MAQTTLEAFAEFDDNLKLDPGQRDEAQKVHNEITAVLQANKVIVGAFLQGSFARKTMIPPLRDVDKIVILHPDLVGLSPDQVMDRIERALGAAYPGVAFSRSRHALKIDFGPSSFYFDTVPAWETDGDADDDVLIANRDTGGWDRSNTRELIRVVAERNSETVGVWIHQVRMAKQVIKNLLDGVIPGLHVESWTFIAVAERLPHDEALAQVLETSAARLGSTYFEPTGVDRISDRLAPSIVVEAKPVLQRAARQAREARCLADAGDHDAAIAIWRELCGECFPAPRAQAATQALATAFLGGSITSNGRVTSSTAGAQLTRPVRSWRPQ